MRRGLSRSWSATRSRASSSGAPDLRFPLPQRFGERLAGRKIEALDRRAKYLLARLDDGEVLVMHLGMTGRFSIAHANRRRAEGKAHPEARAYRVPSRRRHGGPLHRRAALRLHGSHFRRGPRQPRAVQRPRGRAARPRLHRRMARRAAQGQGDFDQGGAARPAADRRARQHLCLRGAVSGRHLASEARRHARHQDRQADQEDAKPSSPPSRPCSRTRSRPAAHPCATTGGPRARSAASSTNSRSTDARASLAQGKAAEEP